MDMCYCCARRSEIGVCRCVIGTCRRCLLCVKHCVCPERMACGEVAEGLDDPEGPFTCVPRVVQADSQSVSFVVARHPADVFRRVLRRVSDWH